VFTNLHSSLKHHKGKKKGVITIRRSNRGGAARKKIFGGGVLLGHKVQDGREKGCFIKGGPEQEWRGRGETGVGQSVQMGGKGIVRDCRSQSPTPTERSKEWKKKQERGGHTPVSNTLGQSFTITDRKSFPRNAPKVQNGKEPDQKHQKV